MKQATLALAVALALSCAGSSDAFVAFSPLPAPRAAVTPATSAPATFSSSSAAIRMMATEAEIQARFASFAGKEVKPVSESMKQFCSLYPKPIIPAYRNLVNDLVQSTHLTVVDARFTYDAVFALGVRHVFDKLMGNYPGEGEAEKIFAAIAQALDLDPAQIKADAEALKSWASSASEADIKAAISEEGSSPLAAVAGSVKSDEFYLYSRLWGVGIIGVMDAAGLETTEGSVCAILEGLDLPFEKVKQDYLQFADAVDKMEQVEQLFKEIEIREKKRMADRLEAKAKKAMDDAAKASASVESPSESSEAVSA